MPSASERNREGARLAGAGAGHGDQERCGRGKDRRDGLRLLLLLDGHERPAVVE